MSNRTVSDFAADSPYTYEQLKAMHRDGSLASVLATLTPRQRIGCAAVNAERTGRTLESVMARFDALAVPAPVVEDDDQAELIESLQTLADSSDRPQDYARAVEDVRAGVTCESIADGIWHVQRTGHGWHVVTREACDCPAQLGCRHRALVHGVEFQLMVQEAM